MNSTNLLHTYLICIAAFVGIVFNGFAQIQKGNDIDGEMAGDYSGFSVSMPDPNTVGIGSASNDDNGADAGQARVFVWTGSNWIQKSSAILGEAPGDRSGFSVSMPDLNNIAIGAPENDGNGDGAGHVRVYAWNGSSWMQRGYDIDGEAVGDESGWVVCMPDANTVAIGAPRNDGNASNAGHVRVYSWNGSIWTQKGADLDGDNLDDHFGTSISMPDANTIGIGEPGYDGSGSQNGRVRIYSWNGVSWVQKGSNIDGFFAGAEFGTSVSMPDANTIAVGAPALPPERVRIYSWDGNAWNQKGNDIWSSQNYNLFGSSVSMSDINTVAVGAPYYDVFGYGMNSGQVQVFWWNGGSWVQKGMDIVGEFPGDFSGRSVSMPDSNIVGIGADFNNGNGLHSGHVRVYSEIIVGIDVIDLQSVVSVSPNPFKGQISVKLGNVYSDIQASVINELGQEVICSTFNCVNEFKLDVTGEPGVYFIEIDADGNKANLKAILE